MKKLQMALLLAGICAMAMLPARGQDLANTFYFKADAGVNWTSDTDLEDFFGPVDPGSKVGFDLGPRFGIAGGYNVTDWFATELEVGFMWNEIDYISGADYVDAYVGNTPFLVNLKLELPTGGPIRPYIGAGAGGSAMFLDADYIELGGTGVWGTEGTVVFAYQFFAGVRFEFAERMSLGVEYRYGGTGDPEFESDWGYGDEGIRFGRIETHSVSATFTYRF